ncbi:hypothetical protein [Anaerosphaera multitolerans]|uniref:Uncharacterized protein n=1 Tax=Anaerosphaera multitolerans TaxID=2487351 RepID=A0A437S4W1_9FIRM|nr:hypothetical protein [Anaerosphaera multitolerans]RVU54024.1 hypothetical protein EF514_09630 [Anaerosphaera multitolerans]
MDNKFNFRYKKSVNTKGSYYTDYYRKNGYDIDEITKIKELRVFESVSGFVFGGTHFDILDYRRKKDNQRVLAALRYMSDEKGVIEELYVTEIPNDFKWSIEDYVEALKGYIENSNH